MSYIYKIIHWYFSKDALPYWCILVVDCLILLVFFFFGYYCVLGGNGVVDYFWQKLFAMMGCMVFYLIGFKLFQTYSTNQSLLGDLRLKCETFKAIVEK